MFGALDSGYNGVGSSPGWDQCFVFLGKTMFSRIQFSPNSR